MIDYERLSDVLLSYLLGLLGELELIKKLNNWGYNRDDLIELGFDVTDINKVFQGGVE
jgi:hypothetical protein